MEDILRDAAVRVIKWNMAVGKTELDVRRQMAIFIEEVLEADAEIVGTPEWLAELADVFVTATPFLVDDESTDDISRHLALSAWAIAASGLMEHCGGLEILTAKLDNNDAKFYMQHERLVAEEDAERYRAMGEKVYVHMLESGIKDEYDGGYYLKDDKDKVRKPFGHTGIDVHRIVELAKMEYNETHNGSEEVSGNGEGEALEEV